jgi:rSAM/selenodomain-associated transferase 1
VSTVIVLAKEPVPGRVKTRLCPPCTPEEAARIAGAALADTLAVASTCSAGRRVLALDGAPGPWLPDDWQVVSQVRGQLGRRLAAAFARCATPAVLVGMDTPQLDVTVLDAAFAALTDLGCDAVLGPARDGGYWAIGFARHVRGAFRGVPMSVADTCASQLARLAALGMRTWLLPVLRDVDHFADATAVARATPGTRFADAVQSVLAAGAR